MTHFLQKPGRSPTSEEAQTTHFLVCGCRCEYGFTHRSRGQNLCQELQQQSETKTPLHPQRTVVEPPDDVEQCTSWRFGSLENMWKVELPEEEAIGSVVGHGGKLIMLSQLDRKKHHSQR